jgi:hypothetical protein
MIEFKRKACFQPYDSNTYDLIVTAVPARSGKQYQISFRISKKAMQKLRLLHSDRVTAAFDESEGLCSITRVADETGNRISTRHTKGDSTGQVRFTCTQDTLAGLGLIKDGKRSGRIVADLMKEDGRTAVFLYEKQ